MKIEPVHPLDPGRIGGWETGPIDTYDVEFWRQPLVYDDAEAQRHVMWVSLAERRITEATDVREVIEWADAEAERLTAAYTLYALVVDPPGGPYARIWIGGLNPTYAGPGNFARYLPPGMDPVWGSYDEIVGD